MRNTRKIPSNKSIKVARRPKRIRINAAVSTATPASYNKYAVTSDTISELQPAELRNLLKTLCKKNVVMIAGYPNIKALVKDNKDMVIPGTPKGTKGKHVIQYGYYSTKNIVRALVA